MEFILMTDINAELYAHAIPEETLNVLREQAEDFLDTLVEHPLNSPGFQKNVEQLHFLGAALSKDLTFVLTSPTGNSHQRELDVEVEKSMSALNELVHELTPNARTTFMSFFSGKKDFPYDKYFAKYEKSQDNINAVIRGLLVSRDALLIENGRLQQEKEHIFSLFNKVNEHEVFVKTFLEELENQCVRLTKTKRFSADYIAQYNNEVKLVLNQKLQDFLTLKTVTLQSYAALTITYSNNETLRQNLEHAKTVTVYALQTAYRVAQSVATQNHMLNQIETMTQDAEESLLTIGKTVHRNITKDTGVQELTTVFDKITHVISNYNTTMETISQEER